MTVYVTNPFPQIGEVIKSFGARYFNNLANAVKIAANMTLREWLSRISSARSKDGWKRGYADAVHIEPGKGDFDVSIKASGLYPSLVENGRDRWSIKDALLKNAKHKNSKGERYAIVFMQKGKPGTQHIKNMPEEVYRAVSKIDFNSSLGKVGNFGMTPDQIEKGKKKGWKSGLYEGMTRSRREHHTQYGTFRVVTKNSKGWMYPAIPGTAVFEPMAKAMKPRIEKILQEGVVRDLEEGLDFLKKKMGEAKA